MSRLIFHIDANSAYLSWEATYRLQQGEQLDLRTVPSVVGGDEESRHGIVLTKSIPAKKFNIQTGETLYNARAKCPDIVIVPPRYWLYMKCSAAMHQIFQEYTPQIQRFSVDESFLDFSNMEHLYPDYMELAETIKERIKSELGFTVNIGISNNKLLAKVASDFKKPDMIHTLFPHEIKQKMWKLPVEELFMIGRATAPKLHNLNINTIGDLANYDVRILKNKFKSHGQLIWNYANGIELSEVRRSNHIEAKGIGNSTTISFDVEDKDTAHKVLLSLCETVAMRLRDSQNCCTVVSVSIRGSDMISYSRQKKLIVATDSTMKIYEIVCFLFDSVWKGNPIRHLGIHITDFCNNDFYQRSLLDTFDYEKDSKLNKVIDGIRLKYGCKAISKSCFLNSGLSAMCGGIGEEDYPLMSSIL
ncbi:DNA polymerase IV [Clostridium tagluense]|uniref:DNA polymerase Y family protein n=1 Tax=Clostridium tagluense TaxID=360422 RepID=UPI001CF2C80B|nr:DNA polymerase IV [Clostridium tagluense]MCB2310629.1 DNA polymerase IV [Clostridium tagluense]MCB2315640.1 DNA polymerase IV [Clostridium tagluense]MCB2320494.1 DNA polymerase IV [Clostridium tagluense]MCB2325223.1 DNA polymerase IV [Clostridium tagluense]MCB2330075.1 DNA polymerase IV [Clostridium tagluense]